MMRMVMMMMIIIMCLKSALQAFPGIIIDQRY